MIVVATTPIVFVLRLLFQTETPPLTFTNLMQLVAILLAQGGWAAFVAMLVNVLKALNVVKDNTADTWATGFNIVGLALLFVTQVFPTLIPGFDIVTADSILGQVAQIGVLVLGLVLQLYTSRVTHQKALRGNSILGTSFSGRVAG